MKRVELLKENLEKMRRWVENNKKSKRRLIPTVKQSIRKIEGAIAAEERGELASNPEEDDECIIIEE